MSNQLLAYYNCMHYTNNVFLCDHAYNYLSVDLDYLCYYCCIRLH